jgi:hypothetical protein
MSAARTFVVSSGSQPAAGAHSSLEAALRMVTFCTARDQDDKSRRGRGLQIIEVLAEAARDHDLQYWRWEIIRQLC